MELVLSMLSGLQKGISLTGRNKEIAEEKI